MTTTEIPEEIMREAKAVVHAHYDPTRNQSLIDIVASALMARDQRAAGIALKTYETIWIDLDEMRFSYGGVIASAILTYSAKEPS